MGIPRGAYKFLLDLRTTTDKIRGKVLQLGRQLVYLTPDQVAEYAREYGVEINNPFDRQSVFDAKTGDKGYVNDIDFFKAVGFDEVESMDKSAYEQCDIIHDLNTPVAEKYHGQYDAIYDGGTLEHIFHFPNCLENIHRMLKPGGVIMHCSPSHNQVDHGFYMFSPTVFYDYYSVNKYRILKSNIVNYHSTNSKKLWTVYGYEPGAIDHLSLGGWGKEALITWFVAEKTEGSTCGVIPQQNYYVRLYGNRGEERTIPAESLKQGALNKAKKTIKRNYILSFFAKNIYRLFMSIKNRKSKKGPKAIARY